VLLIFHYGNTVTWGLHGEILLRFVGCVDVLCFPIKFIEANLVVLRVPLGLFTLWEGL
jgi:uncharacterized membrane protein YozB (DUF420 family)